MELLLGLRKRKDQTFKPIWTKRITFIASEKKASI